MPGVPLPLTSLPGVKPQEAQGVLVNAYAEKNGESVILRGAPGLQQLFEITGHTHCRGLFFVTNTLFVCLDDRLYTVTLSGTTYTAVDRGAVGGEGPVTFARNNKSPTPDICLVADSTAYQVFTDNTVAAWPDADVGSPNSVTSQSGYFIWSYGDGIYRVSGLNDTSINTLDFAAAESKPDTLYRVIPFGADLLLCGSQTIEPWRNVGNETGSPFNFVTSIPRGLAGPWAIAGFEDGFANTIIFAGDDDVVYRLNGYQAARLSTHAIERDIAAVSDKTTLEAGVYMLAGHACWVLSSPDWTWVYDLTSGTWHQRNSSGVRWRASAFAKAWGGWISGDTINGKIYTITEDYYRDGTVEIVGLLETAFVKEFPARFIASNLQIDMTHGTGIASGEDPIQTDPMVWVSWSLDGGYSWSTPLPRAIGKQGKANQRIVVSGSLGMVQPSGFKARVRWSTPSHIAFNGMSVDVKKLRN